MKKDNRNQKNAAPKEPAQTGSMGLALGLSLGTLWDTHGQYRPRYDAGGCCGAGCRFGSGPAEREGAGRRP